MSPWLAQTLFYTGLALAAFGFMIAVHAVFADAWRLRGRPRPRRCPRCWYDLRGLLSMRCPECGYTSDEPALFHRVRRRWGRAAAGLLMLLMGACCAGAPLTTMTKSQILALAPEWMLLQVYEEPISAVSIASRRPTTPTSGTWAQAASAELVRRGLTLSTSTKRSLLRSAFETGLPLYVNMPASVPAGEVLQVAIGGDEAAWLPAQLGCKVRVRSGPRLRRLLGERAPEAFEAWGMMSWVRPVGVLPRGVQEIDLQIEIRDGLDLVWSREVRFAVRVGESTDETPSDRP